MIFRETFTVFLSKTPKRAERRVFQMSLSDEFKRLCFVSPREWKVWLDFFLSPHQRCCSKKTCFPVLSNTSTLCVNRFLLSGLFSFPNLLLFPCVSFFCRGLLCIFVFASGWVVEQEDRGRSTFTQILYLSTTLRVLYLSISIFCNFILQLLYISERILYFLLHYIYFKASVTSYFFIYFIDTNYE